VDPIPLPPPYGGLDQTKPVIALEAPFCQSLHNFNSSQDGVTLRNGDSKYKLLTMGASGNYTSGPPAAYGNTYLFLPTYNRATNQIDVYDVDAGTVTFSYGGGSGVIFYPLYFNQYLFFFTPDALAPGICYSGAAWAAIGYTGTGFLPKGGCVYNHRAYIIQYNTTSKVSYWYSGIDAVSGACTEVDISGLVAEKCTLEGIATITISDNIASETLIAFIFSSGEVLFYKGTYPNASDWTIAGKARIAPIVTYTAGGAFSTSIGLYYQGDYLVYTTGGVISLRDLFLKGSEAAANLSVNTRIHDTWVTYINQSSNGQSNVYGVWDPITNRIIIQFPFLLDSTGATINGNFYFIYNTIQQSWMTHSSTGSTLAFGYKYLVGYKQKVLSVIFGNPNTQDKIMVYLKEGATGYTDRNYLDTTDKTYDYEIISAPISNGRAYVQKAEGLDVIMKSDMYDITNFQFVSDLGVKSTTAQKTSAPTGSVQKPFVNMGIEGSYIQYKISGTTTTGKTTGLEIYGLNLWVEMGTNPR